MSPISDKRAAAIFSGSFEQKIRSDMEYVLCAHSVFGPVLGLRLSAHESRDIHLSRKYQTFDSKEASISFFLLFRLKYPHQVYLSNPVSETESIPVGSNGFLRLFHQSHFFALYLSICGIIRRPHINVIASWLILGIHFTPLCVER